MITPHRLSVNSISKSSPSTPKPSFPSFTVGFGKMLFPNELLLDVADYKHILDGPAILLVGHEGRLRDRLQRRKTWAALPPQTDLGDNLSHALGTTLSQALHGVKLTENDVELQGKLKLRTDGATIVLLDRLNYPNMASNGDGVRFGRLRESPADRESGRDLRQRCHPHTC